MVKMMRIERICRDATDRCRGEQPGGMRNRVNPIIAIKHEVCMPVKNDPNVPFNLLQNCESLKLNTQSK